MDVLTYTVREQLRTLYTVSLRGLYALKCRAVYLALKGAYLLMIFAAGAAITVALWAARGCHRNTEN